MEQELREDFLALAGLSQNIIKALERERWFLESHPILQTEFRALLQQTGDLQQELSQAAQETTPHSHTSLLNLRQLARERLRVLHSKLGFVLSAGDWQSPSYLHSLHSQAGKQEGRIYGTENDYKRDLHLDALAYERAFVREYVRAPLLRPRQWAYITSSGMAAFTTVLEHLRLIHNVCGPVLVGKGCYFENRWILERAFPGNIHLADEMDAHAFIETAKRVRPQAIFLDSLCNTQEVALPNLPLLLPALSRVLGLRGFLVLDNSGLGASFQPLYYIPRIGGPRLFVLESLNKLYQFGMDRVTGGIIWTQGGTPTKLLFVREHLGTILPDASTLALPAPDRKEFDRRAQRLGRNAFFLAQRLEAFAAAHPEGPLAGAVYPRLASHPAYTWAKEMPFTGAFLALTFRRSYANPAYYQSFIRRAIAQAKKQNVPLIAGTSFGLDITRVYLTALRATNITRPFVRIAAGMETEDEMENLANVFEQALMPK